MPNLIYVILGVSISSIVGNWNTVDFFFQSTCMNDLKFVVYTRLDDTELLYGKHVGVHLQKDSRAD